METHSTSSVRNVLAVLKNRNTGHSWTRVYRSTNAKRQFRLFLPFFPRARCSQSKQQIKIKRIKFVWKIGATKGLCVGVRSGSALKRISRIYKEINPVSYTPTPSHPSAFDISYHTLSLALALSLSLFLLPRRIDRSNNHSPRTTTLTRLRDETEAEKSFQCDHRRVWPFSAISATFRLTGVWSWHGTTERD